MASLFPLSFSEYVHTRSLRETIGTVFHAIYTCILNDDEHQVLPPAQVRVESVTREISPIIL